MKNCGRRRTASWTTSLQLQAFGGEGASLQFSLRPSGVAPHKPTLGERYHEFVAAKYFLYEVRYEIKRLGQVNLIHIHKSMYKTILSNSSSKHGWKLIKLFFFYVSTYDVAKKTG